MFLRTVLHISYFKHHMLLLISNYLILCTQITADNNYSFEWGQHYWLWREPK